MIELADKMTLYGGYFAKAIAQAILHADPINLRKLEDAFEDLIESYRRFL